MAEHLPPILDRVTSDPSSLIMEDLHEVIQRHPMIDNHAHNLLGESPEDVSTLPGPKQQQLRKQYPFTLITSEAKGKSLEVYGKTTLAHHRAIRQLAEFYSCPATLEAVEAARREWIDSNYDGLIARCFEGTSAILLDDGINDEEGFLIPISNHPRSEKPCFSRIVRIESVAEDIFKEKGNMLRFRQLYVGKKMASRPTQSEMRNSISDFGRIYSKAIASFALDGQVRGFKSAIAYRSGLAISIEAGCSSTRKLHTNNNPQFDPLGDLPEHLLPIFLEYFEKALATWNFRINSKAINDYLVIRAFQVLIDLESTRGFACKPFQFHTGIGDNDMELNKANPMLLQPLIKEFGEINFVLLHAAYPYTREAGWLAANFDNVWLDIGLVFPVLGSQGQEATLRQALELVPSMKLLFSTDGRFYPETYWLANTQFRLALKKVLSENVVAGDITVAQAIQFAVNIMFQNSNQLYYGCSLKAADDILPQVLPTQQESEQPKDELSTNPTHSSPSPSSTLSQPSQSQRSLLLWDEFIMKHPSVKYIWLQYLDYTATMRIRMVPVSQFPKIATLQSPLFVPMAVPSLLQNDSLADGAGATGQFTLLPDLSTLHCNTTIDSHSATVQTWWIKDVKSPNDTITHLECCPRNALSQQVRTLKEHYDIDILLGFEIEVVFMRPVLNKSGSAYSDFLPLHEVHAWSTMSTLQLEILPAIEQIVEKLHEAGISVPQFHAESAPGQWEFPLPAKEPLAAVDALYRAREIIRNVAAKFGYRATFYPLPFEDSCGTASHVHFSINGPHDIVKRYKDTFLAGVLNHLRSIVAFTLPIEESYERVKPGIWAGGVFVCWGTQNRETPIRKCGRGHWELKTVDGIGNMYLSAAALLASGLDGLNKKMRLQMFDCFSDPSEMSDSERCVLGIRQRLPNTPSKALQFLMEDHSLLSILGQDLVEKYTAVKSSEAKLLGTMGDHERRVWLISRY